MKFFQFGKKEQEQGIEKTLKDEKRELERQLNEIITTRTKLLDIRVGISAGLIKDTSGSGVLGNLKTLTATKENLELRKRVARLLADCEEETLKLQGEINTLNSQLGEAPILIIDSPISGEQCKIGEICQIRWESIGPVNNTLKIELLDEAGKLIRVATPNALNNGSYDWVTPKPIQRKNQMTIYPIKPGFYRIKLADPGLASVTAISDSFELTS